MATRILIVEDDEATRYALSRVFAAEGFEVDTAEDGERRARGRPADASYDMIVLDWALPRLSGIDVCRTLRPRAQCRSSC